MRKAKRLKKPITAPWCFRQWRKGD